MTTSGKEPYYVTMTWDNFPEGGSFGTVVHAKDYDEAEEMCRQEMAELRAHPFDEGDGDLAKASYWFDSYANQWHVIDCYRVKDMIEALELHL